MTLFMLQMRPDMTRLIRWARDHRVLPRDADGDLGYSLHALLAAAFGDSAPKPFAFLRDVAGPAQLLAYSALDAAALRAHAASFAMPEALYALGLDTLASKPMPAAFAAGRKLGFTVRIRPVVRTDRDGQRDRNREIDAFQAAIAGMADDGGVLRAKIYGDWLTSRMAAAGGAVEPPLTLTALRRTPVFRRDRSRGLQRIGGKDGGPDATFSGTIAVTDPDRFHELLARGIGRHRAFGFGMLLLRPA